MLRALVVASALGSSVLLVAQRAPSRDRVMFVTVVDASNTPVKGLGADDFLVREDGAPREVLRAEPATEPIEITVLVDTSDVSQPFVAYFRDALTEFTGQVGKGNHVALTSFGGPPRVLQNYTATPAAIKQGIGRIFAEPGNGAYLLEALMSVTSGIAKRAPERAEILALLIRSAPEFSDLAHERVVAALASSFARFDAITVQTGGSPPFTGERAVAYRERETVLDEGSRRTGGRNDIALAGLSVGPCLKVIGTELLNQYRLVYARPESLIPPEKIEVAVKKPGLTARGTPARSDGR